MHVHDFAGHGFDPSAPAHVLTARDTTPDRIALAISMAASVGEAFRAPLLRAVAADTIALAVVGLGQTPPLAKLDRTRRPAVLVLLADDDTSRVAPADFPHAARALRWGRGALIHAAGGEEKHYLLAAAGAQTYRRLVVVETCTCHLPAWSALAQRTIHPGRILHIAPPPGGVHPAPPPAGDVH